MKTPYPLIMLAALCIAAAIPAHAQTPPGYPPSSVPSAPLLAPDQLQDLVGRVALYHFKILTAQGEAAPGGKDDYLINGHFIGGFALIAWPAEYGKTGVMTFIVNHYGDVYERDLGPDTSKTAAETAEYNPDKDWTPADG